MKKNQALIVVGAIVAIVIATVALKIKPTHKSSSGNSGSAISATTTYKNGVYAGSVNSAYYGNVQVQVTVQKGKIISVSYLQYPTEDTTSIYIAKGVLPYLNKEVIKAQSANVNTISGATYTSQAYIQSLTSALQKA